jgi:radical SAM protein with 4Fe4S-binding SPASM domain
MTALPGDRPPPGAPPLRLLFWESTARCNLACAHCRRLEVAEAAARDDLTTDEFRGVLDSAATLGKPIIVFSGGEPLLRDDWEALADHARALRLPSALATNGTLIDHALAGRIAAAGFRRVSVSLDGADAATHDAFRRLGGAFDRAMAGIEALRRAGAAVQVNATIAAHNVGQLDALHDLAVAVGAEALHLFLLVPVGCGAQIQATHQLPAGTYERVLEWVLGRQAAGGIEIKATCAPHYYRLAAQRGLPTTGSAGLAPSASSGPAPSLSSGPAPSLSRGCLCGVAVAFVSHKGEVFPCGYLPVRCGSVRQRPLAAIWRDSEVFAKLRDYELLEGKCGRCEFKAICGGCRARAYALTGNYLAAEPACTYRPQAKRAQRGDR